MANKAKFTTQQVIGALQQTRGLVFLAAQLLHCTPETVQNYCQRHPSVEAAKQAARGTLLDVAEAKLFLAVDRGEPWAISFALKTVGRQRGYGESLDVSLTIRAAAARVSRTGPRSRGLLYPQDFSEAISGISLIRIPACMRYPPEASREDPWQQPS